MAQACPNCDASWSANATARFCPLCGAALHAAPAWAPPPPARPAPPPPAARPAPPPPRIPELPRTAPPSAPLLDDLNGPRSLGVGYGLWALCLVGVAGVHRFYGGHYLSGALWLLTWGLLGIGSIVDLFLMRRIVETSQRRGYSL